MKTKLISIGDNKVIAIPPEILEKWQGIDTFEIELENNHLTIYPINNPRYDWEEQFKQSANQESQEILVNDHILNDWDQAEWQW